MKGQIQQSDNFISMNFSGKSKNCFNEKINFKEYLCVYYLFLNYLVNYMKYEINLNKSSFRLNNYWKLICSYLELFGCCSKYIMFLESL